MITILAGGAGHGGDIRAGFLLGQRERGYPFAGLCLSQNRAAKFFRAGKADRAGAETLHGEGEVGEAVMPGKRLAGQAGGAAVDRLAAAGTGRCIQQTGLTQRLDDRSAGIVRIRMVDMGERAGGRERIQLSASALWLSSKNGQSRKSRLGP